MAKKSQSGPTPAPTAAAPKPQVTVKAGKKKKKGKTGVGTTTASAAGGKKPKVPKTPAQNGAPSTDTGGKKKKKKAKAVKASTGTGSKPVSVQKAKPLKVGTAASKPAVVQKISTISASTSSANAPSSKHQRKQSSSGDDSSEPVDGSPVPISASVERQFYESHLLLYVLGQVRGEHKKRQNYTGELDQDEIALRRSFVDKLAYICDFTKSGKTVTALALQQTCEGVIFWLAANETVKPAVTEFLMDVLLLLKNIGVASKEATEAQLLELIVPFNKTRLDYYWSALSRDLPLCIERLKSPEIINSGMPTPEELATLTTRLSGLSNLSETRVELVKACFEARKTSEFETLAQLSTRGKAYCSFFSDIRHLLGRLGEHVKATKTLIAAALRFPGILDEFTIKVHRSPKSQQYFKSSDVIALEGMAGRIFTTKEQVRHYQAALNKLQALSDGALLGLLQHEYTFKTRIHAELLLVDLFYWSEFEFFDDDAYVGCSKPACFNCYQYISLHPRKFVLPACHNKLYLQWRSPDIPREVVSPSKHSALREAITLKMNARLREELRQQIDGKFARRPAQYDSVTGTSSYLQMGAPRPLASEGEDAEDSEDDGGGLLDPEQSIQEDTAAWETDESEDDLTWYGVEKSRLV